MAHELEQLQALLSIEIPTSLISDIKALHLNPDTPAWEPSTVTYKFKNGPLECPFYKGYFYIPGFSKYAINIDGDVLTVKTGKRRKWTKQVPPKKTIKGGYLVMPMTDDTGARKGVYRHRCLVITFRDYDNHPDHFIVNHINGIGGDDRLDNLEITTYSGNIKHAYDNNLYPNKVRPIDARNWITGETSTYPSIQACADAVGLTHNQISMRLRAGNNRKHEDGWRFKDTDQEWLKLDKYLNQNPSSREIIGRNVFTNEELIFENSHQASSLLGLPAGNIKTQCDTRTKTPSSGWQFRYLNEFSSWPVYSEQELAIFRDYPLRPGMGIEVHDSETNQRLFFTSPESAGLHFGISPITASKLARYNGVRQRRYWFKLIDVRKNY